MALFRCSRCGAQEDVGLTDFFEQRIRSTREGTTFTPHCSECRTGFWHGQFPKQSAEGMYLDVNGYLHEETELKAPGRRPMRIVGRIGPSGETLPVKRPRY